MRSALSWRSVGALLAASLAAGCDDAGDATSYLRIELVPDATAGAAVVTVANATSTIGEPLCIRLGTTASFVLSRAAEKDAGEPVTVVVKAFASLAGSMDVEDGKSFGCPSPLSAMPISVQSVTTAFCQGESRRLAFQLGSTCAAAPCAADQTCGAGLDSAANDCPFDACCPLEVPAPCALPDIAE